MEQQDIYVSQVFNKTWTVAEWRKQWNELQHWRYTNEMGFIFTVHDKCANQHNPIDYTGSHAHYAVYTFGWAGRWYFDSFMSFGTRAWSGPWIDPFIGKHPGFATEKEAIAECFAQMLEQSTDNTLKKELQKGLAEWRSQQVTQLELF